MAWARLLLLAGLCGGGLLAPALAEAADCKAPLAGRSRSSKPASDAERQRLATEGAIAHWRQLARQAYGWRYRYWNGAQNKRVRCTGNAGSRSCVVTARPCLTLG